MWKIKRSCSSTAEPGNSACPVKPHIPGNLNPENIKQTNQINYILSYENTQYTLECKKKTNQKSFRKECIQHPTYRYESNSLWNPTKRQVDDTTVSQPKIVFL